MVYLYDYSAANDCTCPECGKDFTSKKQCGQATCPFCDHKGCNKMDMEDDDANMMDSTWKAFIKKYPRCAYMKPFHILKEQAMVAKEGNKWCVFSMTGKKLGCYDSEKEARDRLAEIEMFKHMKSDKANEEFARQECECSECGAIYWTPGTCDDAYCPVCHAGPGENEELTGVL